MFWTTPRYQSVDDIPVDGSVSASEIIRCCVDIERYADLCLRQRPVGLSC